MSPGHLLRHRLAEASSARSSQHLFWFRRAADVRQAILDGWSTYWIATTCFGPGLCPRDEAED